MLSINKPVVFSLLAVFCCLAGLPANAGYYKTVYVEDTYPQTTVVVNNYETKPVVVEQPVSEANYQMNPALAALGIGAVVGGIILGVSSHNHHKKNHKHPPISHKKHHKRR